MNYWILLRRCFRSFSFLLIMFFMLPLFFFVFFLAKSSAPPSVLGILSAFLAWAVVSIIKADTCRKSTLIIPYFRKRVSTFYISVGIFIICVFALANFLKNREIVLGLDFFFFIGAGLFIYGFFLFVSHFFPIWIAFIGFFVLFISNTLHVPYYATFQFMAIPIFIIGLILIILYRHKIVYMTEESNLFRAQKYPDTFNIRSIRNATKSYYTKKGFRTNEFRFTFETLLSIVEKLNISKTLKIFILNTLKTNINWLSFLTIFFFLIFSIFLKPSVHFLVFFPAILMWNAIIYGKKYFAADATKPIAIKKLFITEYAGYYASGMMLIFIMFIGMKMPNLIPWKLVKHYNDIMLMPNEPILLYIFGGLFVSSLSLLIMKRLLNAAINYLILFLSVGATIAIIYLSINTKIINTVALSGILMILTILFSLISFKLDMKKDIAS